MTRPFDRYTGNFSAGVMRNFEKLVRPVHRDSDWFISINAGKDTAYGPVETPIKENTLYLSFFDLPSFNDTNVFTEEQAKQTAEFIKDVKARNGNLWVNCVAGISRSGAVVETLIRLGWKDIEHPVQETRYPNPVVWKRLTKQFPQLMMETYPMQSTANWARMFDPHYQVRRFWNAE